MEDFITLLPDQGVAILNRSFIDDPYLRCTCKGIGMIKQIMEKLSQQGYRKMAAPLHLDIKSLKTRRLK